LTQLVDALARLRSQYGYPVVCSIHPRTASKIEQFGIRADKADLRLLAPMSFFDFVHLEQNAFCCVSDSGTVQEEACIFGVPNVTIREVTERPETVECGSNFLAGTDPATIVRAVEFATQNQPSWQPPPEYLAPSVAETTCRIVAGFHSPDRAELEWTAASRA
jgi:UDP-N-acetylglucosamine 2-epimerase (non-hydrolysing)